MILKLCSDTVSQVLGFTYFQLLWEHYSQFMHSLYESPENPTCWVLFFQGDRERRLNRRKCGRGRRGCQREGHGPGIFKGRMAFTGSATLDDSPDLFKS